jgi:hypothetical protein
MSSIILGQNWPTVIILDYLLVHILCGKTAAMAKYE